MKALITGINGFVGRYLAKCLIDDGIQVSGTTRDSSRYFETGKEKIELYYSDLDDPLTIYHVLYKVQPDLIFHLAGQSNVKQSWSHKAETFIANVNKTIHLLEACLKFQEEQPDVKILTVGSSEEYGVVPNDSFPISEEIPLNPASPYGASKAAVSMLCKQYYEAYGLRVTHARPFNHIGPNQRLGFVVPDFAHQIVQIEQGLKSPVIMVGNLSAARDFTDVRDIVRAYRMLMETENYGNSINVCTGKATPIEELLDIMLSLSNTHIELMKDTERLRPSDIPIHYGNNNKLKELTGWSPIYSLNTSLKDILNSIRADYLK